MAVPSGVFLNNGVGLKIDTVDLSDHVTSATLTRTFDALETTAMGDGSHTFVKGLEASSLTVSFLNDTATNSVLQTLQSNWGTTVPVKMIQFKGEAVSAANPVYEFSVLVNSTTDINGATGDLSTQDITFTINTETVANPSGTF